MTHIYNTSHLNINKPPKHFLSITHEIYKSFGEGYETRSVFFDISKAVIRSGTKFSLINL